MKKEERENRGIREMIEKFDKNRCVYGGDSETYFNIINDYLNSVSKYSKFSFDDKEESTKSITVFDDYYKDEASKTFIQKYRKFHRIEWINYDPDDKSNDLAFVKITSHFMAKRGGGVGEYTVAVQMHTKYAERLFEHAEKIACLKSVIKK